LTDFLILVIRMIMKHPKGGPIENHHPVSDPYIPSRVPPQQKPRSEETVMTARVCQDCGADISDAPPTRKLCLACGLNRRLEYMRGYRKDGPGKTIASGHGNRTLCICPMCRRQHYEYTNWTGHGTPRIYCKSCKTTDAVQSTPNETYRMVAL